MRGRRWSGVRGKRWRSRNFGVVGALEGAAFLVKLRDEEGERGGPRLVGALLPIVEETSLEKAAGVHLFDNMYHLFGVRDRDAVIEALDLALIQWPREGGDVGIGRVRPRGKERRFDGDFFRVGDDEP